MISDLSRGQIAQNIAATRRNRDQVFTLFKGQSFQIHERIFPDLRIDESRKRECEQPLLDALLGNRLVAVHCLPQSYVLASTPLLCRRAVCDRLLDQYHFSPLIIEWPWALPNVGKKNFERSSFAPVVSCTLSGSRHFHIRIMTRWDPWLF